MGDTTGDRLKLAIASSGMSLNEISRVTGLQKSTIKLLMSGHETGYFETWIRLCGVLGVSLDDMAGRGCADEQR